MKRVIEFIADIMGRYSDCIERNFSDISEYIAEITENIVKYGKWLLTGLFVVIGYLFLAVTIPVWYLPYKYFKRNRKA